MEMFSTHCWGASIVAAIIPPDAVRLQNFRDSTAARLSREVCSGLSSDLTQVNNCDLGNLRVGSIHYAISHAAKNG